MAYGARRLPSQAGLVGLLAVSAALPGAAEEPGLRQLRIESDPPGAEVLLIGGSAGRTPLSVGERAIYPNDYTDEQASLYGLVTLRREGCATQVQRVTLDDIERGMHITLDCDPVPSGAVAAVRQSPAESTAAATPDAARAGKAVATDSLAGRRLRQLQVLQELRDDGLISTAEEERIRRALLRAP
jgi:hypothetical protein